MQCAKCGSDNSVSSRFCASCGSPLGNVCPSCGFTNSLKAEWCGGCGTPLGAASKSVAERRHLTIFFVDLAGSTALAESMDPEELGDIYARYRAVCSDAIRKYDGHIAQFLGDGILAYFGYPNAHEDDAFRAILSGLEILNRTGETAMHGARPFVRIGVHTGLVVVGDIGAGVRQEALALGEAPNIAARVQSEAEPDTMLITEATRRLVRGSFKLEDLGRIHLKGVSQPLQTWRVLGLSDAASRFDALAASGLAPFVGREKELEMIRTAWAGAKEGHGQTILLRGEAGIGKSRLLGAARDIASSEEHEQFAFECSPFHANSPFYPVVQSLKRRLGIKGDVSSEAGVEELERLVEQRGLSPAEAVPILAALCETPLEGRYEELELAPTAQRQRTLAIMADLLLGSHDGVPSLVVMEDLHWADPSTLHLLTTVVSKQADRPLLVVASTRPELPELWSSAPNRMDYTVEALPRKEARHLVEGVIGGKALPEEVLHEIIERTAGIPLFVEAVTRTVIDAGVLTEREDRYELSGPLPEQLIPATVHDSLMARIDQLAEDKATTQLAATIGREFTQRLLQVVSEKSGEELEKSLNHLMELELVARSGLFPDWTYAFKHALVRDAAYESLLKKTRQEYHGKIADALVAEFSAEAESRPELLARHFEGAGRTGEAVDYWMKAGFQAAGRAAVVECVSHLRKAISLLQGFPEDDPKRIEKEMAAQLALAPALMATRGWGSREVEAASKRAKELCEITGNGEGLFAAMWGLWTVPFVRGQMREATEAARALMELVKGSEVPMLLVTAHYAEGFTDYCRGEFEACFDHWKRQHELFDLQAEREFAKLIQISPTVVLRAASLMSLQLMGFQDQAAAAQEWLAQLVRDIDNPAVTGVGIGVLMYYLIDTRDAEGVAALADRGYDLSVEAGFEFWSSAMLIYKGWAMGRMGDTRTGHALMHDGLERFMRTESGIFVPIFRMLIADVLRLAGRTDEALDELARALEQIRDLDEHLYESEILRLEGEVLLAGGDAQAAEAALRRAMDVARDQKALLMELRAANVLARHQLGNGRSEDVRSYLPPLYERFTEGHSKNELLEARALIEELA